MHIESWVGRDLSKYIPGLYWQTYISVDLAKEHSFDLAKACQIAEESTDYEKGVLLRFFEDPLDWNQYAEKLDNLCLTMDGVFSIKEVHSIISSSINYIELCSVLRQWK
ncbi:MAG: hypothetical protein COS35_03360 [Zetaproteobacteria bacterium CG02_land_8_20_14_3_00_50_9]|nr:MAG: hypothetical protein COS35_03360 [Zetaproteobacteria bacterium CG02_land_8_20_14_3_00_50_9]PIY57078.1 MAG: hypothetical protein COZ00_00920 [Zetaproteobacteria bacterium CG_4_10_14_0_8_um_filter_49_80]